MRAARLPESSVLRITFDSFDARMQRVLAMTGDYRTKID